MDSSRFLLHVNNQKLVFLSKLSFKISIDWTISLSFLFTFTYLGISSHSNSSKLIIWFMTFSVAFLTKSYNYRVLLGPPTTDHSITDPTDMILFQRLDNWNIFILQKTNTAGKSKTILRMNLFDNKYIIFISLISSKENYFSIKNVWCG